MTDRIHHTGPDSPAVAARLRSLGMLARVGRVGALLVVLVTPGPDTLAAILADTTPHPVVFVPCPVGSV